MTKNEVLTVLLTLDEYNQNHLLKLIRAWQLGNKTHPDYFVYSLNDAKKLVEFIEKGYKCEYIETVHKFFTLNEETKTIKTACCIRSLIDLNSIAQDITENNLEWFYCDIIPDLLKHISNA